MHQPWTPESIKVALETFNQYVCEINRSLFDDFGIRELTELPDVVAIQFVTISVRLDDYPDVQEIVRVNRDLGWEVDDKYLDELVVGPVVNAEADASDDFGGEFWTALIGFLRNSVSADNELAQAVSYCINDIGRFFSPPVEDVVVKFHFEPAQITIRSRLVSVELTLEEVLALPKAVEVEAELNRTEKPESKSDSTDPPKGSDSNEA